MHATAEILEPSYPMWLTEFWYHMHRCGVTAKPKSRALEIQTTGVSQAALLDHTKAQHL